MDRSDTDLAGMCTHSVREKTKYCNMTTVKQGELCFSAVLTFTLQPTDQI